MEWWLKEADTERISLGGKSQTLPHNTSEVL